MGPKGATFNASARKSNVKILSILGKFGNGPTFNASAQKLEINIIDTNGPTMNRSQEIMKPKKMLMVKEIVQLIIPDEQPCFDLTQISTKMEQLCEGL